MHWHEQCAPALCTLHISTTPWLVHICAYHHWMIEIQHKAFQIRNLYSRPKSSPLHLISTHCISQKWDESLSIWTNIDEDLYPCPALQNLPGRVCVMCRRLVSGGCREKTNKRTGRHTHTLVYPSQIAPPYTPQHFVRHTSLSDFHWMNAQADQETLGSTLFSRRVWESFSICHHFFSKLPQC